MAEQRTLDAERAELYSKAVAIVREKQRASVSLVQRRLNISWNAARDLIELMLERKDVPVEWAPPVYQLAARRAPPALDAEGLPTLPEPYGGMLRLTGGIEPVYTAEQVRQAMRDAVAADRRARRPIVRTTLSPEMKAALEEAFKTRSTAALLPGGSPVFINYGDQPEDTAHLSCTACGGSGHIDDQQQIARQSAPEGAPVGMVLVPVEMTDAMWRAWNGISNELSTEDMGEIYRAMLLAAPTSASAQSSSPEIPDDSASAQPAEGGA